MIDSRKFAEYILVEAKKKSVEMNLTKLQKIMFICDGTLLAYGENIIDEHARAFDYGPVYPKAYKWYKNHRNDDFSQINTEDFGYDIEKPVVKKIVNDALSHFGSWSAGQLSEWSHRQNSPWDITVKSSRMYSVINKNIMKAFFGAALHV